MGQEHIVICSGYGAETGNDILTVRLTCAGNGQETGQKNGKSAGSDDVKIEILTGLRQGNCPSFGLVRGNAFYAAEELSGEGYIRKYEICPDGSLADTGKRIQIPGGELCHLYAGEKALYASCYGTGDFCAVDFELEKVLWHRQAAAGQKQPHAHWISERGGILYLADLGSDRVYRYQLEDGLPEEELEPLVLEDGAGPRQPLPLDRTKGEAKPSAVSAAEGLGASAGERLLTVQELDSTLRLWENGSCVETARTTAFDGTNYPGTICMADEETVLVCNRGANTVAAFRLEAAEAGESGKKHPAQESQEQMHPDQKSREQMHRGQKRLTYLGEWKTGDWPRYLYRISGTALFLNACNQEGALILFEWTGKELVQKGRIELPGASCAAEVPAEVREGSIAGEAIE